MAKAGRRRKEKARNKRFLAQVEVHQHQRRIFAPSPLAKAVGSVIKGRIQ